MSRLHRRITPAQLAEGRKLVEPVSGEEEDDADAHFVEEDYLGVFDEDIRDSFECYLNLPESENPEQNPLSYDHIREQQQADTVLLAVQQKYPHNYFYKSLSDDVEDIICYAKDHEDKDTQWRIALPGQMLEDTV